MAVEALQINKSKEGEKSIPVKERTLAPVNVPNEDEADGKRYEQLLVKHGIPDTEKFSHKREQLFLMVEQDLSDAFIGKVMEFPSKTIDRLRLAAFVVGEEFLESRILGEVPEEEQIREWIKEFTKAGMAPTGGNSSGTSVEKSLDIMGKHMVRQQEIAGEQISRLTEYLRRVNEVMQERSERDLHSIREENQKERERAQKQIDLLSDENFRLNMKVEDMQEEAKKKAEEIEKKAAVFAPAMLHSGPVYQGHEKGMLARRRRIREQKQREAFISSVLGNGEFTKEQLKVVERVVHKDFTLQQLQRICDPQVKPENMELLEAYYLRRQMHG